MGVPFEALLPFGIVILMGGVTGAGLGGLRYIQHGWKRPRYGLDTWDNNSTIPSIVAAQWITQLTQAPLLVIERDRRLTGDQYGQTDEVKAPADFSINSAWRLEKRII
ncbi:hypothetical protein EX30DRAFT_392275 [Ascodesmis nigricans]|uniref:NADH dehydrogenase [ubiquinone] 1 alpha subcomplex subunit 1 n=1 Tax=Ascodesmis nigricans TaxID=341454 RepID=A0A4V3SJP9_9PEZI|nr:hypothetical protein EX30DRAFT_392275 [Ascodesmis nigricans]